MNEFPVFTLWLAVIAISLLFTYIRANGQKKRIVEYLTQMGASAIGVQYRFFDFDKTNLTFDVSYRDAAGDYHNTVCKVRMGWLHDQSLYWDRVPQRIPVANKVPNLNRPSIEGEALSNKAEIEKLMSELIAENARLRTKLKKSGLVD